MPRIKPTNNKAITAKKKAEGKDLGGRPPFQINYEELERLCGIFCTGEDCAYILGCSYQTLNLRLQQDYQEAYDALNKGKKENEGLEEPPGRYNGFQQCFKKCSAKGRESLRREQYKMATEGDPQVKKTMLIWMGKQHLEQRDRHDHTTKDLPLPGNTSINALDLSKLNKEEFDKFGELLEKSRAQPADDDGEPTSTVH